MCDENYYYKHLLCDREMGEESTTGYLDSVWSSEDRVIRG